MTVTLCRMLVVLYDRIVQFHYIFEGGGVIMTTRSCCSHDIELSELVCIIMWTCRC